MLCLLVTAALAQECPTPGDCDGDGWTVVDGDCNDGDPLINPGRPEACDNAIDDDCDRLFNEGCDRTAQRGTLDGGGACGTDPSPVAALFLLPLLGVRRR